MQTLIHRILALTATLLLVVAVLPAQASCSCAMAQPSNCCSAADSSCAMPAGLDLGAACSDASSATESEATITVTYQVAGDTELSADAQQPARLSTTDLSETSISVPGSPPPIYLSLRTLLI